MTSRTYKRLSLLYFAINTDYSRTTDTEFLLVRKSVNGPLFKLRTPLMIYEKKKKKKKIGVISKSEQRDVTDQLAVKFTIFCNKYRLFTDHGHGIFIGP